VLTTSLVSWVECYEYGVYDVASSIVSGWPSGEAAAGGDSRNVRVKLVLLVRLDRSCSQHLQRVIIRRFLVEVQPRRGEHPPRPCRPTHCELSFIVYNGIQ